jgi:hypothetical protein
MKEGRDVADLDRQCAEVLCGTTWDEIAQARATLDESILHLIDEELEMAIKIAWEDYSYELEPRGAAKEKMGLPSSCRVKRAEGEQKGNGYIREHDPFNASCRTTNGTPGCGTTETA